ncbi:fimbrial protein [Cronobacter dublinensis]
MKKTLTGLTLSTLLFSGISMAEDTAAALSVSGTVSDNSTACQVTLSKSSVNLTDNINQMINQGDKATSITPISMTVMGVNNNFTCGKKIYDGRIAVRFLGTHDNADGSAFANTASGEDAATGVGIGLFETNNNPIDINQPWHLTTKAYAVTQFFGLQLVKLNGQTATSGKIAGDMTVQVERL